MNNALEVSLNSLEKAKYYKNKENYGRSFAHYLVFLELSPNDRNQNEFDFLEVLFKWVNILEKRNQIENMFKCYLQALNYFPSNIEIIHNLGAHLLRIGEVEGAEKYIKLATILDDDFLPAEKNLYTLKLNLVPRWHFRMLNDHKRNLAFKKAILSSISTKCSNVLDIGTGTGILSLFASSHNDVSKVVAVEESKTLCKVSEKVIKANGAEKIILLNKHSSDLVETDLSNVLVMEIFDAGIFGEHVLETLIHAWEHLLEKNAVVIPKSVVIYITGIECLELYKTYKVLNSFLDFNMKLDDLCITKLLDEPYDAENLLKFDFKCVTNSHEIFIDFSKLDELRSIFTNADGFQSFKLTVLPEASVHAFAIWFDLNLNDEIQITTNPFKENCKCWEQAVIYLDHPYNQINSIDATISCLEGKLQIRVQDLRQCAQFYKVSGEMVTFLNDLELFDSVKNTAEYFSGSTSILDLNPFPIFGLVMAQKSAYITCLIKHENDKEFLKYICEKNNISNVEFFDEERLDEMLQNTCLFDIIFINVITSDGLLNEKHLNDLMMFQNLLKPNGIILPETVQVVFELIESPMLDYLWKVQDDNCLGFKIAEFINEYSVPELWSVNPRKLLHKTLTRASTSNNLMCINNIQCIQEYNLETTSNGEANGILYWYKIGFKKDKVFDTFESIHYNCACFLLENRNIVTVGKKIVFKVKIHNGLLKIYK